MLLLFYSALVILTSKNVMTLFSSQIGVTMKHFKIIVRLSMRQTT
jgi:hypothetical protein